MQPQSVMAPYRLAPNLGTRHLLEDFCTLVEHGPGRLEDTRERLVVSEMLGIFEDLDKGQRGIEDLSIRSLYPSDEIGCMKLAEHLAETFGEKLGERPKTAHYISSCKRVLEEYQRRLAGYDTPRFPWQPGERERALEVTQMFVRLLNSGMWSFYPED